MPQNAGTTRQDALPDEAALLAKLQPLSPAGERQKPAAEQFEPYREELLALVDDPQDPLTLKSAWQVITHRHPEMSAAYRSLRRVMRGWTASTTPASWRHETPQGLRAHIAY